MKKKWFIIIGAGIVLVVFVALALNSSGSKKTAVTVEKAGKGEIISIVTATGKVKAESDVQISADVMGRIERMPVKEGDIVKTGQLLVQLDSRSREMDVAQAKGSVLAAKSSLENANITLEREKQLFQKNLSSQASLDLAQSNYDQAYAQVQISQANLDRTQDQLDKTTIRAPMSGVVTKLNSEVGENVVIGTMNAPGTVIMVISDLSAIEIEADVDETDVASVKVGQPVKISLDAFPDTTFKGVVTEVGNSAQQSVVGLSDKVTNFTVKILIQDTVPDIKPGMTASVDITTARREDAVKVPSGAVVMRPEGTEKESLDPSAKKADNAGAGSDTLDRGAANKKPKKDIDGVFVVRQGKASFVPVRTGIRDQQFVEITSGLAEGDSVVTGPYRTLRIIKQGEEIKPEKSKFATGGSATQVVVE